MKTRILALASSAALMLTVAFCSNHAFAQGSNPADLTQYKAADKIAKENLAKFDARDFEVFTNQEWDRFKESHADDIVVVMPDGYRNERTGSSHRGDEGALHLRS